MGGKGTVKCAKCGITSKDAPSLTFHRFPLPSKQGPLNQHFSEQEIDLRHRLNRAKVWATFCYPGGDWTTIASLEQLYAQHKMLCGTHFDNSSFTSSDRKRLNKFAIPIGAQDILVRLRSGQQEPCCSTSVPEEPQLLQVPGNSTGILQKIDVRKVAELTPKKKKLYRMCRRNLSEITRLRKKIRENKTSRKNVLNMIHTDDAVNNLLKAKISSSLCLLLQSNLKNTPRKLPGRRWTLDDKVLALSLYKRSSSCYRLLRRLFCLPSVSSLKLLLNKIPLLCGINSQIFDTINKITTKRDINDNLCILAFDEMSIRKNLSYNIKMDVVDGYQDHGYQGRSQEVATHALTFMAIGLRNKWKQPIAFYFSGDHVTSDRLAALIKEVLSACFRAGLEVVGVVNDCDGVNLRAINNLGSTIDQPYFNHEGHQVITILDPPHLLKCFRNNFLKHNIEFMQEIQLDGKQCLGTAKWNHIERFYNIDKQNPNFVFAPALTHQHLQPNGKQKMKVKLAAQTLSHSVAAGIFAKVATNELPQEALATAMVVSNIDNLFDAVNGDTPDRKRGKPFLTNMSTTSPHRELFKKMKKFFMDMKFLGARSKPPSQDGWLRTLNAIEKVFDVLRTYNVNSLAVRRLNQDPLENCFGCIRSNCGSNPNPTTIQFIAAFKTSIMTNLINSNKNRNCLDDNNNILNNFKEFLHNGSNQSIHSKRQSSEANSPPYQKDNLVKCL